MGFDTGKGPDNPPDPSSERVRICCERGVHPHEGNEDGFIRMKMSADSCEGSGIFVMNFVNAIV